MQILERIMKQLLNSQTAQIIFWMIFITLAHMFGAI